MKPWKKSCQVHANLMWIVSYLLTHMVKEMELFNGQVLNVPFNYILLEYLKRVPTLMKTFIFITCFSATYDPWSLWQQQQFFLLGGVKEKERNMCKCVLFHSSPHFSCSRRPSLPIHTWYENLCIASVLYFTSSL